MPVNNVFTTVRIDIADAFLHFPDSLSVYIGYLIASTGGVKSSRGYTIDVWSAVFGSVEGKTGSRSAHSATSCEEHEEN